MARSYHPLPPERVPGTQSCFSPSTPPLVITIIQISITVEVPEIYPFFNLVQHTYTHTHTHTHTLTHIHVLGPLVEEPLLPYHYGFSVGSPCSTQQWHIFTIMSESVATGDLPLRHGGSMSSRFCF